MSDLTTVAKVKTYGGITVSTDDALLATLVTAASLAVENYLGRTILSASYVAVMDGNGASLLPLPQYPITAISYVKINGLAQKVTSSFADGGYSFRGRSVYFPGEGNVFKCGLGNVEVSYTAGFSTVPTDIDQAVCEVVMTNYKTKDQLGWSSKSLAGETISVNISLDAYSKRTQKALDAYKNYLPI